MRTVLSLIALALGTCTLALAQEKAFESKEGKFKAKFPGDPKDITQKAGGIDLHITIVDKQTKGGYAVIYSDMPADVVKATPAENLLKGGEKGLVDNFKAKVTSSKDTKLKFGTTEYAAREIVATKDELHLKVTLVLSGNRLYQIFVVGPKETVDAKEAEDFLKSFEIIP